FDVWKRREFLEARLKFKSFLDAVEFVREVAMAAERLGHHPDLEIHYDVVVIATTTHDAGDRVTERDMALAEEVEKIYKKWQMEGRA
ncbi:MAG: 4a-hydroxytetrahydrobiopterin dehydratase, partial [Pyrobaculum sp.]